MYMRTTPWCFIQLCALALGCLTLMLATTHLVQAEVVTVCSAGGEFTTVQAAIDAANAGDSITLCAATYTEPLHIDKDLILRGAGQGATIIGGQTVTSVVSLGPDVTLTLADLTLAQGGDPAASAAAVGPYTDTLTITNTLNLTGGDQVTTIINGDVSGNVVIVQANTKVYVVNVTISLPATTPAVIAALAGEDAEARAFDGACLLPLNHLLPLVADLLESLCDVDALNLVLLERLDALPANEADAVAAAAYGAVFGVETNLALQGADQITTIVNGDVSGNLAIVQANTTVDVTNVTITLTHDGAVSVTDPPEAHTDMMAGHNLYLPVVNG